MPNGWNIDQMAIKYRNIFHCKTLQNSPKVGFLVRKETIWQLWFNGKVLPTYKASPNAK
jgi:hypothetical protein